eukprot:gene12982-13111_t
MHHAGVETADMASCFKSARKLVTFPSILALYLPAGFPASVTDDYLAYQLYTIPAHITGWLSSSLTTSSLLKAVGINAGPVGATAAAAAIKWIVKDGLGAAGRLLVGGRLGQEFDDDPRRWRMTAEAFTTAGLALEIATAIYPSQFLLLASLGNFSKALGKGMGKPVFRVIQTHFAATGNVGAVAAKEEVWEVSAQLAGYVASVLVLQSLQDAGSWQTVVGLWAGVQAVHVGARYLALQQLRFPALNQKRASLLVAASVRALPLPTVAEGNRQEPMLLPTSAVRPHVTFGCSLQEAWGGDVSSLQSGLLQAWLEIFRQEEHLLVWRQGHAYVVLKQGSQQGALLRALWQAAWLDADVNSSADVNGPLLCNLQLMQSSVAALQRQFAEFDEEAKSKGWHTGNGCQFLAHGLLRHIPKPDTLMKHHGSSANQRQKIGAGLSLDKFATAKVSKYDKRKVLQKQMNLKAKQVNKYKRLKRRLEAEGKYVETPTTRELEQAQRAQRLEAKKVHCIRLHSVAMPDPTPMY